MDPATSKRIVEAASDKLVEWQKRYGMMQLRLRCAEIVFTAGSQDHKTNLETHAGRLFDFVMERKESG